MPAAVIVIVGGPAGAGVGAGAGVLTGGVGAVGVDDDAPPEHPAAHASTMKR
jgi:uncharacterized membrane protein